MAESNCRICLKPFRAFDVGTKNNYRFLACRACGSVVTDPPVTHGDLVNFFNELRPEVNHIHAHDREIGAIRKRIDKAAERSCAGRRFLDVNCRQGYAVMAAKELGFDTPRGIDIHNFFTDFATREYGEGLFTQTSPEDLAAKGQMAEFVYAREAFCEHPDLESLTAALAKLIAPGGRLYIEEPDGNSFWLPSRFTNWEFAEPPLNFNYISLKGMKALLARHGLKIERNFFTFGPLMRLVVTK